MESVLAIIAFAGITVIFALVLVRPHFVFLVKIEEGIPRTARGKVSAHFLDIIAETCERNSVTTGWIGGVRKGRRIALAFSPAIPPGCRQQLRNEWVMAG